MGVIKFNNADISPHIKGKKKLKLFLISIFDKENIRFKNVSYIFCTDVFLLGLNQEYLNHNTYTDIITFTLSGKSDLIISEIYISVERVRENSVAFNVSYKQELYRVMIHGILHLCGFSDHSLEEKKLILEKENFYLSLYGFT